MYLSKLWKLWREGTTSPMEIGTLLPAGLKDLRKRKMFCQSYFCHFWLHPSRFDLANQQLDLQKKIVTCSTPNLHVKKLSIKSMLSLTICIELPKHPFEVGGPGCKNGLVSRKLGRVKDKENVCKVLTCRGLMKPWVRIKKSHNTNN